MTNIKSMLNYFLIVVLLATALVAANVSAQEPDGAGGSGLRVSPTRTELSIRPGEVTEVVQTVRNVTSGPVTVTPTLNDFEADGVSGKPLLIGDPNEISANSLREFVSLPGEFQLQPEEEQEVTVVIDTPADASPGAYYGSVLYRASPVGSSGDGQVALVASVGSLLLVEVPGQITEQIEITDLSAYIDENAGTLFTQKPNNLGVTIKNLGNSFAKPFGKIVVNDFRGNNIFEYEMNPDKRGNVLPDSSRLFLQEFFNVEEKTVNGELIIDKTSPLTWPGRYTISGNISHGTTGEIFTVNASFWYLPVWLIVVLLIAIVVLVLGAVYFYRKYVTKSTKRR